MTETIDPFTYEYNESTEQLHVYDNSGNELQESPISVPDGGEMHIAGHLYFSMDGGKWQYDNRLTSNEEKQYSFAGSNYNTTVNPLNSMQLFWGSGQNISGEWNIWGRDRL